MSDLRHIHDPVHSSLKMEGIRLSFLINHLLVLPIEVQYSCVFAMVLRVVTYYHASGVQCIGRIERWESGFRIGPFGAGGSVRAL
jgi:hypothetical protein